MQRFGRLQLHGPAGRQPGAQCNDQSHKQQHPTKTDRKAPPSERAVSYTHLTLPTILRV